MRFANIGEVRGLFVPAVGSLVVFDFTPANRAETIVEGRWFGSRGSWDATLH